MTSDGAVQGSADARTARGSVRGHVLVGTALAIDSDTANPTRPFHTNDTLETAEDIPNSSVLGGYLGTVPGGVDRTDVYRVDLDTAETVSMYRGTSSGVGQSDFGVSLYDSSGNLVDDSLGTGAVETVQSPTTGTYRIEVTSPAGESGLYALSFGAGPLSTAFTRRAFERLSSRYDFVPGEALVKLAASSDAGALERLGLRALRKARRAAGYLRVALGGAGSPAKNRRETLRAIRALRTHPELAWAEPNYLRRPAAAPPNDSLYPEQWNADAIHLLEAWDHARGTDTVVGIVDTGVKRSHPDFVDADATNQLLPGYDMISDATSAADGDGRDANPDDPGDRAFGSESSWHGTHMAGIVAAATNNSAGCAGVAPEAKILPVRAFGVGGGTTDDLVQGILYAAGLENASGQVPPRRADVINLSVSGRGASRVTAEAVAAARSAGVIVVAAAGNEAGNVADYSPAGEPGVVSVGATDRDGHLARYSNFGSTLDLVAPGGDMNSDLDANGTPDGVISLSYESGGTKLYGLHDGTSPAAAHVSGVIALMKSVYPDLSPSRFDAMLASGASPLTSDLGPSGRDAFYGYGLIDANLAVLAATEAASEPTPTSPTLRVSTTTLDFGGLVSALPLRIDDSGAPGLVVESVSSAAPWIRVAPGDLGDNVVTIDRAELPLGPSTATLTIQSNGGNATIDVTARGLPQETGGDIGTLIVRLLDGDSNVVAETRANPMDGYAFEFSNVEPGAYSVVAGTDLDADGTLGSHGEAYGAYSAALNATTLVVGTGPTVADFAVGFMFRE